MIELALTLKQLEAFDMVSEIVTTLTDYLPGAQGITNADSGETVTKDMLEQTAWVLGNLAGASGFHVVWDED